MGGRFRVAVDGSFEGCQGEDGLGLEGPKGRVRSVILRHRDERILKLLHGLPSILLF